MTEGFEDCELGVQKVVRHALSLMAQAGAVVEDVSVPLHKLGKLRRLV